MGDDYTRVNFHQMSDGADDLQQIRNKLINEMEELEQKVRQELGPQEGQFLEAFLRVKEGPGGIDERLRNMDNSVQAVRTASQTIAQNYQGADNKGAQIWDA